MVAFISKAVRSIKMKISRSADVRVYLFTYRRNHILPRAVQSPLQQTHSNWICELHNDDPNDSFPEQLVAQIDDPRIKCVHHEKNLGAVSSFNLAFRQVSEPFISILEDDNWWEAEFLGTMLKIMDAHPQVSLSWANMWQWREGQKNSWKKEGTIWPFDGESEITLFERPDPRGICSGLHSNGAMLLRSTTRPLLPVPETLPFLRSNRLEKQHFQGRFYSIANR